MSNFSNVLIVVLTAIAVTPALADELLEHSFDHAGAKRTYYVHRSSTTPDKPVPLVVVLHGGGGNGKSLKDTYGFKPFVTTGECVAVYPDALAGGWVPDDVGFLDAMIDEVFAREKVDRDQLFVTGASRGGLATFLMAAKSKHRIRAAGTVIATQLAELAKEFLIQKPIDFAMIAGTADPLMPYKGGWGAMRQARTTGDPKAKLVSVDESIQRLLKANAITSEPEVSTLGNMDTNDGCTNEVRVWTDGKSGHRVMLVTVNGGGHVVPGGRQYLPKNVIGPACGDFDHATVMWNFFRNSGASSATRSTPGTQTALEAASEKALRDRVAAMYAAMLAGDVGKCIELSDQKVIRETGRDKAEQFFKAVIGLVKFGKLGPNDRRIASITPLEGGKAARVEIVVTLGGKPQKPGIELWRLADGEWYYQETLK